MHWDKTCSKEKSRVFCIFTDFKVIQGCFTPLNNMHQQDFQTQFFGFYFDWINLLDYLKINEFVTDWKFINWFWFSLVFKVREAYANIGYRFMGLFWIWSYVWVPRCPFDRFLVFKYIWLLRTPFLFQL